MLEMILDKKLLFVLMGIVTGLGVADKCVVSVAMRHMVEAAGSMSKSNHPLMRLVRAKFEHACMISDTVENVEVFVDKYLYEYQICGLRLHTMQRMEKICAGLLVVTGLAGAGITYQVYGMSDAVLRIGACGIGLGILLWLFHLTTDETYCMQMAKNYMVDYLENVCLHKYEKGNQKDRIRMMQESVQEKDIEAEEWEKEEKEAIKKARKTEKISEEKVYERAQNIEQQIEQQDNREDHSVVQMQRENRRKERTKGAVRNPVRVSARLAGAEENKSTEGTVPTETIQAKSVQSSASLTETIQEEKIHTESMQDDNTEHSEDLPKDEMIRQILREFMA